MPIVWNEDELRTMSEDMPDTGPLRMSLGSTIPGSWGAYAATSLTGITRSWNDSSIRALVRKQLPDLYGAMMAPLKETPRYMGDPNATIVIEWRIRHRR